ncbi:MAG TPA: isochorismatase family cysteine hydrolase [Gaiellales bacterium]|nr:isochorismatase family cysteine hydrolase [Gaiellales bacterium]
MRDDDALVLVDVLANFGHDDGDAMFASFRAAHESLQAAIAAARDAGIPVVYANDDFDTWSGDRERVLEEARRRCPEPALIDAIAPERDDPFLCKPRYSAFDHTPLDLFLREREVRRLLLAGTATEMCVAQSAIDGRELGYQITILPEACAAVDPENADIALRYLAHVVGARIGLEAEAPG